jgi:hypothetical protein
MLGLLLGPVPACGSARGILPVRLIIVNGHGWFLADLLSWVQKVGSYSGQRFKDSTAGRPMRPSGSS